MEIRLEEVRKARKMTQVQLGIALEMAPNTISQYERGVREPDIATIKKFCDFFRVSTDHFLNYPNQ